MDLTFSTHVLAVDRIVAGVEDLAPGVHPVPPEIDERVARLKLRALGVRHDELTDAQRAYLRSWETGT